VQDNQPGENKPTAPPILVRPVRPVTEPAIKFPPLFSRLFHFLFRPESWAEALRFPLRYSIMPLLMAIILSALATAVGTGVRNSQYFRQFAGAYDKYFPAMKYENGALAALPGPNEKKNIELNIEGFLIIVDPSGNFKAADLGEKPGVVVGPTHVESKSFNQPVSTPLTEAWPFREWQSPSIVDGTFVRNFVDKQAAFISWVLSAAFFVIVIIRDSVWSFAMVLTVAPILILASGARQMRLQIAWRGATAFATPLVFLGGILGALGYTPARSMMPQMIMPLWFIAMLILAIWTGRIANRMYAPAKPRRGQ
jgi:hypothetical protein